MAEIKSPEHPLEVLPAMLNLVLIQTGKLLRDPDSQHPRAIGLTRSKINEYVPVANGRFHDALDEIEIKILDAKAVIERDLSVMRKKRAERLGIKLAPKTTTPDAADLMMGLDPSEMVDLQGGPITVNDMTMLGVPDVEAKQAPVGVSGEHAVTSGQSMPPDAENSDGLANSIPVGAEEKDEKAADESGKDKKTAEAGTNGSANQQDQEAEAGDFDLDSMFNDIDFDMDFSMTESRSQNPVTDNAFEDVTMSGMVPNGTSTNDDFNALLPELDAVINASKTSTANPIDTENTASNPESNKEKPAASTAAPTVPEEDKTNPTDSQFDDLFNSTDFSIDGNTDLGSYDFNFEF